MRVQIKATNIALTDSVRDYVDKRLGSLEKFFVDNPDTLVNVEVGKESLHHKAGAVYMAEVHIILAGEEYYAKSEGEDLNSAIDDVKDEITHELVSKRKKARVLLRKGGAKIKNILKRLKW